MWIFDQYINVRNNLLTGVLLTKCQLCNLCNRVFFVRVNFEKSDTVLDQAFWPDLWGLMPFKSSYHVDYFNKFLLQKQTYRVRGLVSATDIEQIQSLIPRLVGIQQMSFMAMPLPVLKEEIFRDVFLSNLFRIPTGWSHNFSMTSLQN